MKKNVIISVCGLQTGAQEEEASPIEIIVPGQYFFRNGAHFLRYEEIMDEATDITSNYVKITDSCIEVRKQGYVNVTMIFEEGKKNLFLYNTPFGMIEMGVHTQSIKKSIEEEQISINIRYLLEMNRSFSSSCLLSMKVQPQNQ